MKCEVIKLVRPGPRPTVPGSLVDQMKKLKPDEAMIYRGRFYRSLYWGARRAGFKITTRKQLDGSLLVWRINQPPQPIEEKARE